MVYVGAGHHETSTDSNRNNFLCRPSGKGKEPRVSVFKQVYRMYSLSHKLLFLKGNDSKGPE